MPDSTTTPAKGRLVWDEVGKHLYETGADRGVLYPIAGDGTYPQGHAWNGLSDVKDSPDGAESKKLYANNGEYLVLRTKENTKGTIEAYTYPTAWNECDGRVEAAPGLYIGQQSRKAFGFSWRSILGNDTEFDDHAYTIHIRYNCTAAPSEVDYQSQDDDPDINPMSWEYEAAALKIDGYKDSARLDIRSDEVSAEVLKKIEDALYGTEDTAAHLPLPGEIIEMMKSGAAA